MTSRKKKTVKKNPRKTAPKKKGGRKNLSQNMRIFLASAFLLGFVALCLVVLVNLRDTFQADDPQSVVHENFTYEEPPEQATTTRKYSYNDILKLIDNQLINGPDSMGWRKLPDRGEVQVRKIFGEFPSLTYLAEIADHIRQTGSSAELKVSQKKGIIHLYWQGKLHLEMQYQVPAVAEQSEAKIAIIMDDMGISLQKLRKLLGLDIIITPSILPGTRQALPSTALLQKEGREYMIHIPMQPRSYPRTNPGSNALLLGQSPSQVEKLVMSYLSGVPGAVGTNNHMGSRYTEDSAAMHRVLEILKKHGLFFIDSRTIGDSVAFSEARKMGVKTATRNIFLDNSNDVASIRKQIHKMVKLAGKGREIIAICHPYNQTLEAFRLEQDWLRQQPVSIVDASQLVHLY